MHAESFHFLPRAFQFAFQDYKLILSAQADSGLLVPGLFNVEKWPGDLGESAIENYRNINLCDLNQNPPCPKYLDYLFLFLFFSFVFCLFFWSDLSMSQTTSTDF